MITRREANMGLIASAAISVASGLASAQELPPLDLPPPRNEGGKPLIEALRLRRSIREYSTRSLPAQVLSDLLWAAFGINRPASGDRTAPYWRHVMVIDIYGHSRRRLALRAEGAQAAAALAQGHSCRDRHAGFCCQGSTEPRLCRSRRANGGHLCRGSEAVRIGRYRLHRPKRLPVLRRGGAGERFSSRDGLRQRGPDHGAGHRAVRHLCPERRVSLGIEVNVSRSERPAVSRHFGR